MYYYNNLREHSSLEYRAPVQCLREQEPEIDDNIRFIVPIMLDHVAVELGPWSGYHLLAHYPLST
jgi:hypothetical protein